MSKNILDYDFMNALKSLEFIEEIWLFGSRARGDHQERSDIDLAIIISPHAEDSNWLEVLEIIENADTLLKIDCVRFEEDRMGQDLYNNILQDKKVIYVKNKSEIREI